MAEKIYLKTLVNQRPICSMKLLERSTDAIKNGNLDKAKETIDKALRVNPKDAFSYGLKGYINHNLGDTNTACKAFKKAISMGDDFTKNIFSDESLRFNYCSLDGSAKDFGEKSQDESENNSSNSIIKSDENKCATGNYVISNGEKFCL